MSLAYRPSTTVQEYRAPRAVYLHSAWRSAGTWIWNEFRARPSTMAFYEPLHEELAALTLPRLTESHVDSWDSGHPQTAPYFIEFAPLMRGARRGVAGFDRSFSFDRYFLSEDAEHPRLRAYLQRLTNVALASGRQPVFKFCRSLGRVGWMKRQFADAVHVTIVRDPLVQWESAWRLVERGKPYFLSMPTLLLARNLDVPLVDAVVTAFDLRLGHLRHSNEATLRERCDEFAAKATVAMTYRVSLAFWLLTGLTSVAHADITIDSDQLSQSADYRQQTQAQIFNATGVAVDFGSARVSRRHGILPGTRAEVDDMHALARTIAAAHGAPELLTAKL